MQSAAAQTVEIDNTHVDSAQVLLVLEKAEILGISARSILRDARLSFDLNHLKDLSVSRIPLRDFIRLWDSAISAIHVRLAGNSDRRMRKSEFELMCHSMITSATLHEVIERLICFFEYGRGAVGHAALEVDRPEASLIFKFGEVERGWEPFFVGNAFALFTRLFAWMTGQAFDATYQTPFAASAEGEMIGKMMQAPFQQGADHRMRFPVAYLDRPIIRDGSELRIFLEKFPANVSVKSELRSDLGQQVEGLYRAAMLQGKAPPKLEELARNLGVSASTLRRQIEACGLSVRAIKTSALQSMAQHYLSGSNLAIHEIAERLGYSGRKSFARAFFAHSGQTPIAYRDAQRRSDDLSNRGAPSLERSALKA